MIVPMVSGLGRPVVLWTSNDSDDDNESVGSIPFLRSDRSE